MNRRDASEAPAAVDRDDLTGHERGVGREVQRGACDVVRRAAALERRLGDDFGLAASASSPRSGHSTGPGAMPLTRTSGASSRASDFVSIASPAFATE